MREIAAKIIFIVLDLLMIVLSVYFACMTGESGTVPLKHYLQFYPLFLVPVMLFAYEGIYTYRYDFWHESRLVLKGIVFSILLVFAYLAMTEPAIAYSHSVIFLTFLGMVLLIPLAKNISKKALHRLGVWQKGAAIYGNDPFLTEEIYGNPYLGYVKSLPGEEPSTVFVNSKEGDLATLKQTISSQIRKSHEVIFIPLMDEYDLTHSHIYELANTRTNLVVFRNRLKSRYRTYIKQLSDYTLSIMIFPLLVPVMLGIAYRIKRDHPHAKILFRQKRLGADGTLFTCYKFRTMYEESEQMLEAYLKQHPEERIHYQKYHKYQHDPRVTEIGRFLRRTSLDELPQIFNVLKGEMSFIGPRPYMTEEKACLKEEEREVILSLKPGITGLWQVSGRNEVDFQTRIDLDIWYIRNWNLWMDLVILLKTVKSVLLRKGAR